MHPWVQKFYPVPGLGPGERFLCHFQTPVLYWINFCLRLTLHGTIGAKSVPEKNWACWGLHDAFSVCFEAFSGLIKTNPRALYSCGKTAKSAPNLRPFDPPRGVFQPFGPTVGNGVENEFPGPKKLKGALRKGPPFHGSRSLREEKVQNASCQMGGREVTRR